MPRPVQRPVVRSRRRLGGRGHGGEDRPQRADVERFGSGPLAGRDDHGVFTRVDPLDPRREVGPEARGESPAPQLLLPVREHDVADQEHGAAVPRPPRLGTHAGQLEIRRQRSFRSEPRVHTVGERVERATGRLVERLVLAARGVHQTAAPREHVEGDGAGAGDLGPPSGRAPAVVLELTEAVLGLDVALSEAGVVHGAGADVRDAPLVAHDLDVAVEPVQACLTHTLKPDRTGRVRGVSSRPARGRRRSPRRRERGRTSRRRRARTGPGCPGR